MSKYWLSWQVTCWLPTVTKFFHLKEIRKTHYRRDTICLIKGDFHLEHFFCRKKQLKNTSELNRKYYEPIIITSPLLHHSYFVALANLMFLVCLLSRNISVYKFRFYSMLTLRICKKRINMGLNYKLTLICISR